MELDVTFEMRVGKASNPKTEQYVLRTVLAVRYGRNKMYKTLNFAFYFG